MRKQIFKKVFVFSVLFSACLNAWAEDCPPAEGAISIIGSSTAIGNNSVCGEESQAFGSYNAATKSYSSAMGHSNVASGTGSSAFGNSNKASGGYSSTVGFWNITSGSNSYAFGSLNKVYAENSGAFGYQNTIGSFIEGDNPDYPALRTYVFGGNITTSASNAVVLGDGSADGGDNTVSVGSANNLRKIVFVNDGDISATSKDAINGSQLNSVLQNATGINTNNWRNALGINEISNNPSNNLGDVVKYDNDAYSVTLGDYSSA